MVYKITSHRYEGEVLVEMDTKPTAEEARYIFMGEIGEFNDDPEDMRISEYDGIKNGKYLLEKGKIWKKYEEASEMTRKSIDFSGYRSSDPFCYYRTISGQLKMIIGFTEEDVKLARKYKINEELYGF